MNDTIITSAAIRKRRYRLRGADPSFTDGIYHALARCGPFDVCQVGARLVPIQTTHKCPTTGGLWIQLTPSETPAPEPEFAELREIS